MNTRADIIYGPPGCGKTTELLKITEEMLVNGIQPEQIAFLSFSRKAAHEARDRAVAKFELKVEKFKWFRTIHSLCYAHIGVQRDQLLSWKDYREIGNALGLRFSTHSANEDGEFSAMCTRGDRMKHYENLARLLCCSMEKICQMHPTEDLSVPEMELLHKSLNAYKEAHDKMDFTDMLDKFLDHSFNYRFHTIFIDEAQDLNPLQWKIIEKLMSHTDRIILAGDDDQAIYQWAGADVKAFIHFNGNKRVLSKSYRVPAKVHEFAEKISSQIQDRQEKPYEPREEQGAIVYHDNLDTLPLHEGSWLLLARNVCYLKNYNQHCFDHGYFFKSRSTDCFSYDSVTGIVLWERLRKGEKITHAEALMLYGMMSANTKIKRGAKTKLANADKQQRFGLKDLMDDYGLLVTAAWYDSLDKIPVDDVQYIRTCLRKGEKLNMSRDPRININTIHGVKGGEADNVVIMPDMTMKTYMEGQRNPDAEHRVWYVGVTRAKQTLHVIAPKSNFYYNQLV